MNDISKKTIFAMLKDDVSTEQEVLSAITEYKERHPFDMDVFLMESDFYMQTGDLERAKEILDLGCYEYPYNAEIHYMSAKAYEAADDIAHAIMRYSQFLSLSDLDNEFKAEILKKEQALINRLVQTVNAIKGDESNLTQLRTYLNIVDWVDSGITDGFGKKEVRFRSIIPIIGNYYYADEAHKKFVGSYRSNIQLYNEETDLVNACGDFRTVDETKEYVSQFDEGIIPVAIKRRNGVLTVSNQNKKDMKLILREPSSFYYLRAPKGTVITSEETMFVSREIPLVHDEKRKKLVLSIFVDGLAQQELIHGGLQDFMPNTYEFFGKKGVVCTNVYCTGEWTLPSISGIMTGINTADHRVFHNTIDCAIPHDAVTLAERMQAEGYYTSAINGNWRIIPCYGMDRGFDSFRYQHQLINWKVEHIIGDAIDHLKAFKETDQYLWLSIGDLHDVADEAALPLSVQTDTFVDLMGFDESGHGTSVKQGFSANKKTQYEKMLEHVDDYLGLLYGYIEKNYSDDEVVISLFSDHGQGFLVPDGNEFFSDERSNVALMFRDGKHFQEDEKELLSTLDYGEIICKMSGVEVANKRSEGQIPVFLGGQNEREFALTESIHPGDFYQARLTYKDCVYHFINKSPVLFDGRFVLGDYEAYVKDRNGNPVQNEELCKKFTEWILVHIAKYIMTES
ncbi:MAG: sulfatase-like hydrolase/transferase [Lachnospiraceae bacterium]|nr:sulfatase-like hydrolase/transferase [Lachnospiraceae bacterium]